jgi:hypothetical protein
MGRKPELHARTSDRHSITEQWRTDAITSLRIMERLQPVYREVKEFPPETFSLFQRRWADPT